MFYLNKLNGHLTFDKLNENDYILLTDEEVKLIGEWQIKCYDPYYEDGEIKFKLNEDLYIQYLRNIRETECFSIINRGSLWYETLSVSQQEELRTWYHAWLNVTETKEIPTKPEWL